MREEKIMAGISRRELLRNETLGLAALSGLALTLRGDAAPTPGTTRLGERVAEGPWLDKTDSPLRLQTAAAPTKATGYGPFYTPGAPFRGKSCPPFEPGTRLVVSGRVWAFDTKKPLPSAVIDIWHSDIQGNYSTGGDFHNRTRLATQETGYYEFEGIHPVAYAVDNGSWWRSPHVHYKVACPGYITVITELYFAGDKLHEQDKVFQPELMMPVQKRESHGQSYESVVFDIVLEPGKGVKGA
jgi:catechol 1,2-dioxygenase